MNEETGAVFSLGDMLLVLVGWGIMLAALAGIIAAIIGLWHHCHRK